MEYAQLAIKFVVIDFVLNCCAQFTCALVALAALGRQPCLCVSPSSLSLAFSSPAAWPPARSTPSQAFAR
jgi:hypothetical protein